MNARSLFVPLGIFLALVVTLAVGFRLDDPHKLPSELIDRPFPAFSLPSLADQAQTLTEASLTGEIALVNVWATWCAACVIEHPELMRIAREEGLPIYGINYNDDVDKARQWLVRYDNPYRTVIVDGEGRLAIDLGVYGAPETFVIDEKGVIQYRHVGVVSRDIFDTTLRPVIDVLRSRQAAIEPS